MSQNANQSDEHSQGHHEVTIYVNTRPKLVTGPKVSFTQIVELAFDDPDFGPNINYTVTYRGGVGHNGQGQLTEGHSVQIKEGMAFNVARTDKS